MKVFMSSTKMASNVDEKQEKVCTNLLKPMLSPQSKEVHDFTCTSYQLPIMGHVFWMGTPSIIAFK